MYLTKHKPHSVAIQGKFCLSVKHVHVFAEDVSSLLQNYYYYYKSGIKQPLVRSVYTICEAVIEVCDANGFQKPFEVYDIIN